jgi:hypothetical protein
VRVRRSLPNRNPQDAIATRPPIRVLLVSPRPEDDSATYTIDPASRFAEWHLKRAAALGTAHLDPLSRTDRLLLAALKRAPDQRMRKTDLQRKLWRIPASMLHPMLNRLVAEDRITIEDDWIYPISRAEFEAKQREARERERRPRLLYTRP